MGKLLPVTAVSIFWCMSHLRSIATAHGMRVPAKASQPQLMEALTAHVCDATCLRSQYLFRVLKHPRAGHRSAVAPSRLPEAENAVASVDDNLEGEVAPPAPHVEGIEGINQVSTSEEDLSYLEIANEQLRQSIMLEWEQTMSTVRLKELVCGVCARRTPPEKILSVKAARIPFELLTNPALPEEVLPQSYDLAAYGGAILHPKGLEHLDKRGPVRICQECRAALFHKNGAKMPLYALANWLYYGHERLPESVKEAFAKSTQVERMLVGRARSSKVSFKFCDMEGHPLYKSDRNLSQGCVKGNVAIHPQDAAQLSEVLPPSYDVLRDTLCAVFVGEKQPTRDTIKKLNPLLVRKSRVKTMIDFLLKHNPKYAVSPTFRGYSQENMDALYADNRPSNDEDVLCAMEMGHIPVNDAVEGATDAGYVPGAAGPDPTDTDTLLMENVGYTTHQGTLAVNPRDMTFEAVAHCLRGGTFLKVQAGSRFIPDFQNPSLLTWVFPHLDPWGIGSFFHEQRPRDRRLSLDQQLKYLLQVDDSRFREDPNFAFVYYNIRQKKAVFDSVSFRVGASQRERVVREIMGIDVEKLDSLAKAFERNPHYKPAAADEVAIIKLLAKVNTVSHDIPGSNGYKIALRNQIRALIHREGTPTLFVTLNPSDRDHPLVRLYAGNETEVEGRMQGEELSRWRRTKLAARNPAACAKFFDKIITNFIDVVLKFGKSEKGLFGKCKAYFGTVEAQGRGTLHCHMLIWLEGHPPPQKLRDKMFSSETYREMMFNWLEAVIKCELPGTTEVVVEEKGHPLPQPPRPNETQTSHPGAVPGPSLRNFQSLDAFKVAFDAFVTDLVKEFNWHEHNSTCFKYVSKGTVPKDGEQRDALCRMRIDGSTRATTCLDDESGSILLRRLHPRIANYNDLVVFLIQSNMDIKFIGSGEAAKALLYYITDYITKASLPAHVGLAALSYAIQKTNDKFSDILESEHNARRSRGALNTAVNRMMSHQEISHQQVMSYLVGGGDHYTSHKFRVLHWGSFDRLFRDAFAEPQHNDITTTSGEEGEAESDDAAAQADGSELDGDDEDEQPHDVPDEQSFLLQIQPGTISSRNQQQDYVYRSLSAPFDALCLYEFVATTESVSFARDRSKRSGLTREAQDEPGASSTNGALPRGRFSSSEHTQYETHMLRKKKDSLVPVILGAKVPRSDRSEEEQEAWARMMLILFVPWRRPSDLRAPGETWLAALERKRNQIAAEHEIVMSNMNVLSECRDVRDAFSAMRKAEALALVRDGMPSAEGAAHTGLGQENISDDYQLFDSPNSYNAYDHAADLEAGGAALDARIGAPAREVLDMCYRVEEVNEHIGATSLHSGRVRVQCEDDDARIAQHSAMMRELKKLRRPQFPGERSQTEERPRKRRRLNEVTESVTAMELDEEASTSTYSSAQGNTPSVDETIEGIVVEFGLNSNEEQERAFRIVADHVKSGSRQLMMYIAGVGGTGKTHVIKAVLKLFSILGRSREILVGAPTGAAALNIDGYTMHALTMLPGNGKGRLNELRQLWGPVQYLIIDEISMIGARFLSQISNRLQEAKAEDGPMASSPFGGLNVIFTGDFGQLKPVKSSTVYSHSLIQRPGLQHIRDAAGVSNLQGVYLWRQVQTVVKLTKNQRQASDPVYGALLDRVRVGQCRSCNVHETGELSDAEILYQRILQQVARKDQSGFRAFADAPVIVGTKLLRDEINTRIIAHKAAAMNETVHTYHAKDKVAGSPAVGEMRRGLWKLQSSVCGDSLGKLPLFPGMKVMIRENLAFSKRLVNGAEGTITDIVYEVSGGVRYATVVYVRVPGAGQVSEDLEEDVVPIFPETVHFQCKINVGGQQCPKSIARQQLPIIPAYAYTDYKSQGKSLTHAIVDLDSANSLQGIYVMLSRVRSLQGLLILRPFSVSKLCGRLSQELREELGRIDKLADETAARYKSALNAPTSQQATYSRGSDDVDF
ncbi:ATP-dependent DNA helicase PIF1 [Trametes pubescens]|uniref:ATP-dependent DNA helicase n=1 Tax=Trametes pubescens TaxID=154538 RepID=A0A1M2W6B4_TRAPU|nr:ATP-dependent DNA helicase PIF1 [Trametes pubescens]OJT15280.1 ATP-dependent DNA helicase PIF1 [Trametes pubescens]